MTNDELSDNIIYSIYDSDMDKELTPKQQTSEAVRQAESILIMTGQRPSIDQVSAVVSLGAVLRKFGKKVTTVISDDVPGGAKFMPLQLIDRDLGGLRDFIVQVGLDRAEVDKLKYAIEDGKLNIHISPFAGGFKQEDVSFAYGDYHYDLVIVLGVASFARVDKIYAQNQAVLQQIPLINIDVHRSNEQYGAVNLVEPQAAGLGELLVALSESLQTGLIDREIATVLLAGIMSATDRFTATHTTSKALTVAAQMMAMGADQQVVVRGLYRSNDRGSDRGAGRPNQNASRDQARPVRSTQPVAPAPQPRQNPTPAQPEAVAATSTANPAPKVESAAIEPASVSQPAPAVISPAPQPVKQPVVQSAPMPAPVPAATAPVVPVFNQFDTDGPAVTDPDHPQPTPKAPAFEAAPEPLINDTKPQQPDNQSAQAAPKAPEKASNPTNNPIFANRLPW